MVSRLIERADIYLIILVLITVYILIFSDVKYFQRQAKERARNQSLGIGITMLVIVLAAYFINLIWL